MTSIEEQKGTNCGNGEQWQRTGDLYKDLLHLFETGEKADCTFRVGSEETGFEDFKCHKLALALTSSVLDAMLYGHFREAQLEPEEPILLDKVSPNAFRCAMKFAYGRVEDFSDVQTSIQVYLFAHEMQMTTLLKALDAFFAKVEAMSEVLAVLEMYKLTGDEAALDMCKDTVMLRTAEVFASDAWINATEDTVQEVLSMSCLNVSEPEVVEALLRWGRAQLPAEVEVLLEEQIGERLRRQIENCLKLIRLPVFTHKQFMQLCSKQLLGNIFSSEEQLRIMQCIELKQWDTLPPQITPAVITSRSKPTVSIKIPYCKSVLLTHSKGPFKDRLSFTVNKSVNFVGILSLPPTDDVKFNANAFASFTLTVTNNRSVTEIMREHFYNKRELLKFKNACVLEADVRYELTYHATNTYDGVYYYKYNRDTSSNPVKSEGLNVSFIHEYINFKLEEMVFEIPKEK